jgi:hypothetical protein
MPAGVGSARGAFAAVRRGRQIGLVLALLLPAAAPAGAFIPLTLSSQYGSAGGLSVRWDFSALANGRIPYWINLKQPANATAVGPNASPDEIIHHIRNAFQTWENVPTASVRFQYMGTTTTNNGFDGRTVVTFSPQGFTFPVGQPVFPEIWPADTVRLYGTLTGTSIFAGFPGQIMDADFVLNPRQPGVYTVSDDGGLVEGKQFDIEGYLVHEIGHGLGLDHTQTGLDAVMNMVGTPRGGFPFRNLSSDEVTGISCLYPAEGFPESRGLVTGTVRRPDGKPVFGAQVVAMDARTGVIVTGTISGVSEAYPDGTPKRFALGHGEYRLAGLPPGNYRIYAQPLVTSASDGLGGVFEGSDFAHERIETDFTPGFFPNPVTIMAQSLVRNVDIQAGPRAATAPQLGAYTFLSENYESFVGPAFARPGSSPIMSVLPGSNIQAGSDFVPGTEFQFSSPDVTITRAVSRPGTDILLYLNISPNAAPGPRLLQVNTAYGTSFLSGGLVIVPPPPAIYTVTTTAAGATAVILGDNFASASLPVVLFNGEMGTDLAVESSKRLHVTVPADVTAPVTTRVITLGGVARA